jgi:hypothetical protein
MLKYVRLSHPTEHNIFVFTVPPLSHANLANALVSFGYRPISAGFVRFDTDGTAHVEGESTSLRLKPDLSDAGLIGAYYRNTTSGVPAPVPAGP